jgi:hypothetical protein
MKYEQLREGARESVRRGAALLDRVDATWYQRVNTGLLMTVHYDRCVVYQCFMGKGCKYEHVGHPSYEILVMDYHHVLRTELNIHTIEAQSVHGFAPPDTALALSYQDEVNYIALLDMYWTQAVHERNEQEWGYCNV